jgi:molybdopterin-guanine dinucleotide biosynthesis protein A
MDCVVVAGGRPESDDPLFAYTQGKPKALLELAGGPLIHHVLSSLLDSSEIDRIVVVGLEPTDLQRFAGSLASISDQGSLIANGLAGVAYLQSQRPGIRHILFTSADIPAVNNAIVDDIVSSCRPYDRSAYYFMVERQVMESHYPGSNRTYVPLKDMAVAGADMFIADARLADGNSQLLQAMAAGRKQAWKLARIVGPSTLLSLWLHRLTLTDIERRAEKVLGAPVSVRLTDHAQLAMDIDKPEQLLLLRELG